MLTAVDPMNTAPVRLRRACLVVPANDRRKLEKAAGLEVDQVILDLEDAVSPAHKTDDTRRAAAEAVIGLPWRAPTVSIRVNAAESDWFARDIAVVADVAAARLATIVLPKVDSQATVAVAVAEGWRGEICHVAVTDAAGRVGRYKIVDPSFHNWFGLALSLRGQAISDFPLCNKSFNLSYCGFDL